LLCSIKETYQPEREKQKLCIHVVEAHALDGWWVALFLFKVCQFYNVSEVVVVKLCCRILLLNIVGSIHHE